MLDLDTANHWLEFLAYLVTIGGVPCAIGVFILEKRRERREREGKAFADLDQAYVDFQKLCLEHPDLDVFEDPASTTHNPDSLQQRREHAIFSVLISLFERVFILFEGHSSEFRQRQWKGWVTFMRSYTGRTNFRRVWDAIGGQFDARFYEFVANELIRDDPRARKIARRLASR